MKCPLEGEKRGAGGERTGREQSHAFLPAVPIRVPRGEFAQQPWFWDGLSLLFETSARFSLGHITENRSAAISPPAAEGGCVCPATGHSKWVLTGPSPSQGVSSPHSSLEQTSQRPSPGRALLKAIQLEGPSSGPCVFEFGCEGLGEANTASGKMILLYFIKLEVPYSVLFYSPSTCQNL